MRVFLILLISVFFVFNCSKDSISPVPDPSEPLWGNWWGIETGTDEYGRPESWEHVFVFRQDDTFSYRFINYDRDGFTKLLSWWGNGTYTYDPVREALAFYFDLGGKQITTYAPERGNAFILWMVMFTKQDKLPDWAAD